MSSKIDLNPPAYQPTPEEDQLALLQHFIENDLFSMTFCFKKVYEQANGINPHEGFDQYRRRSIDHFLDDSKEFLDAVSSGPDWFKYTTAHWEEYSLKDALSQEHCGDCVALPCTCDRCLAEDYYGIPYTATWSTEEGSKAWHKKIDKRTTLERWFDSVRDLFK